MFRDIVASDGGCLPLSPGFSDVSPDSLALSPLARPRAPRPNYYALAKAEGGDKWDRILASRAKGMATRKAKVAQSPAAWLAHNLMRIKARAARDGIQFDVEPADIELPAFCPITGILLTYGALGRRRNEGPSIDRIKPHLGYVRGNVRILSLYANRVRQNCTDPAIFEALARDAREIENVV